MVLWLWLIVVMVDALESDFLCMHVMARDVGHSNHFSGVYLILTIYNNMI